MKYIHCYFSNMANLSTIESELWALPHVSFDVSRMKSLYVIGFISVGRLDISPNGISGVWEMHWLNWS